jgi:hypothetical protein
MEAQYSARLLGFFLLQESITDFEKYDEIEEFRPLH